MLKLSLAQPRIAASVPASPTTINSVVGIPGIQLQVVKVCILRARNVFVSPVFVNLCKYTVIC